MSKLLNVIQENTHSEPQLEPKEPETKVQGRSFTANHVKLLKHMDKLQRIQEGKTPIPVMIHVSLINACNLTCSFCCCANRPMSDRLPTEKVKQALDSFARIGVKGLEFTGGGEPTLHPDFAEIVQYAYDLGYKIGLCTNGALIGNNRKIKKDTIKLFTWIRLGMYGFYEGYDYDLDIYKGLDSLTVSAAYVWDEALDTSSNPNVKGDWLESSKKRLAKKFQTKINFISMLDWVEENQIPTRIAFNAIKDTKETQKDIETISEVIVEYVTNRGKSLQSAFLSDFNFKGERRNHNCYMHNVKPYVFTNGLIYVCPSACLAEENNHGAHLDRFVLCDIDGIDEFYSKPASQRKHSCSFCKYAIQNELIDDIVTETTHNEFA